MSNIRVDVGSTIRDGTAVAFRSPVDCSQVTGLIVYYPDMDGNETATEFAFADAHGNNVGDIDHLFAENVVVKVILDVTHAMAFVQNADTNAYIERTFVKSINDVVPDKNGNVNVTFGDMIVGQIDNAVEKYLKDNHPSGGVLFETDDTLKLVDGVLSVNTTYDMEKDNTLPITSAGVYATVGNIEALLKTI